jgi:hypothetical protein
MAFISFWETREPSLRCFGMIVVKVIITDVRCVRGRRAASL